MGTNKRVLEIRYSKGRDFTKMKGNDFTEILETNLPRVEICTSKYLRVVKLLKTHKIMLCKSLLRTYTGYLIPPEDISNTSNNIFHLSPTTTYQCSKYYTSARIFTRSLNHSYWLSYFLQLQSRISLNSSDKATDFRF